MAASDAKPIPMKNQAFRVTFPIYDADGDLVAGAATPESMVSLDGAAFDDCTNEYTQITTNSGMYRIDLTAAEMNADTVALLFKTSTGGAKTTAMVLYPATVTELEVNVGEISADSIAANNLELDYDGTGYNKSTSTMGKVTLLAANAIATGVIATNAIGTSAIAAGAIGTAQFAAGAINSTVLAANCMTNDQISASFATAINLDLLKFDMSSVVGEFPRSPINALRLLRNKWSVSGGTLTVTKENDSTTAWTSTLSTTAGDPVTSSDPA